MKEGPMATRRSVASRALLALAGLVGVVATSDRGPRVARDQDARTIVLLGRNWHTSPGRAGEFPTEGDRITVRGDLVDGVSGERVGQFYAAGFAIGGSFHPAQGERLELHTFKLGDGTIIGSGTAGQLDGAFAILGGTGRYAGARGTYVACQSNQDFGGDGSAKFVLTLNS